MDAKRRVDEVAVRRKRLNERLRAEFIAGAKEDSRPAWTRADGGRASAGTTALSRKLVRARCRARLLFVALMAAVAACGGPTPTAALPSSPSGVETPASSAQPPAPNTQPVASSPPAASATPVAWTELERTIRAGIREDAARGCAPRRHNLPPGTIAAVECRPRDPAVARVGFYLFGSPDEAFAHYRNRLRAEGLAYNKGDIGDRHWEECWHFENEGDQHSSTCRYRHAGFVNSSGYANYRAVGDALYVGVLGKADDVTGVWDWVRLSRGEETPPGEMGEVPWWPTLYEGELVSVAP